MHSKKDESKETVSMTAAEIKVEITEKYATEPSTENFRSILAACVPLDDIDTAPLVTLLGNYRKYHGMTKSAIEKELKALRMGTAEHSEFFTDNGSVVLMPVVRALEELNDYLTTAEDDALRVYREGVFYQDRTRETQRIIHTLLGDAVGPHIVSAVLSLLKDRTTQLTPRHTDWINLMNGRWCLKCWELEEHTPLMPSVVQLPVAYDADAECPVFDAWLSDVLPATDDQFLLLQLFGYSMLQDVRFGKIAVLYGPTHTGKSTCLEILRAFLGDVNVSSLTLHALDNEDNRFSRSGLVGKLANVSADLSSRYLRGDSQIKQIATGDGMQVEYKGIQSFSYSPYATLWASCNELPLSHDRTDAWYERLVILPFMQQHTGKAADRDIVSKLTSERELSGILNRVLEALEVLILNNAFVDTASTKDMLNQYRLDNDHVERFLEENYEKTADDQFIIEADLYDHYKEWTDAEGIKPLSKNKLRDGVLKWGVLRRRKRQADYRFFAFEGMISL